MPSGNVVSCILLPYENLLFATHFVCIMIVTKMRIICVDSTNWFVL